MSLIAGSRWSGLSGERRPQLSKSPRARARRVERGEVELLHLPAPISPTAVQPTGRVHDSIGEQDGVHTVASSLDMLQESGRGQGQGVQSVSAHLFERHSARRTLPVTPN